MNITVDRAVIEQALEALDYVMRHGPAVQKAKDLLQDALAQPEQEPVATVTSETGAEISMSWWHEPALPVGTKLYTAPPQRKPLTDEEISAIDWKSGETLHDFARAIEAAHGIKEEE